MWRRRHGLALVVLAACAAHVTHHWRVYDGDLPILEVSDKPGPITSTAPPAPGSSPVMNPFLSAAALDAGHEDQLASLLQASHLLDQFLRALKAAGYRVVPQ
jgi:hypothetical protein